VLDLVEEALDQVTSAVEIWAKADPLVPVAPWWNVGPSALLGSERSDPIRIIASVGQQHCFRLKAREELASKPVVMSLTRRQCEPDWQTIGIDQCMTLAGQPAS